MSAAARGAAGYLCATGQMRWRKEQRERERAELRLRQAIARVKVTYKKKVA